MSAAFDAADVGARLARALEEAGHPYALGGALAYGFYGIPRATHDVDINVFVEPAELGPVLDTLSAAGVALDRGRVKEEATEQGLFVGSFEQMRVDFFTPSIPFSWEALRTRVRRTLEGRELWILSAESVTLFKLLFFRSKDLVDLERLVAVQGKALDTQYIRLHLVQMMGEDDVRVARWDELVRDFMPR